MRPVLLHNGLGQPRALRGRIIMARGRKPADQTAAKAARAARERIERAVKEAGAGIGFVAASPDALIVEHEKIQPFLTFATQLATFGDQATKRVEGWAERVFAQKDEVEVFTRGLRRAVASLGYTLKVAGPIEVDGGLKVQYKALKKPLPKSAPAPGGEAPEASEGEAPEVGQVA